MSNDLLAFWEKTRKQTFNYDLKQAPTSGQLQLLMAGGTINIGVIGSVERAYQVGVRAWAPTAERVPEEEEFIGMRTPSRQ
jgi:hypothetical protein